YGEARFRDLYVLATEKYARFREGHEALFLIYSIGKSGTQTVEQSLLKSGLKGTVRRSHLLSRTSILTRARETRPAERGEPNSDDIHSLACDREIRSLLVRKRAFCRRNRTAAPIRVIC